MIEALCALAYLSVAVLVLRKTTRRRLERIEANYHAMFSSPASRRLDGADRIEALTVGLFIGLFWIVSLPLIWSVGAVMSARFLHTERELAEREDARARLLTEAIHCGREADHPPHWHGEHRDEHCVGHR